MLLSDLFQAEDLVLGFDPRDKWVGIDALVSHLAETGRLPAERLDEVREAVLNRERSMSTGFENGVAIPHAAVEGLDGVIGCVGIVSREEGLPFDSIDGQPARVVVLLVIPLAEKLQHIRTLSDVALVLRNEDVRTRLLATTDAAAAHAVLCSQA
tara:strand:- start:7454 stop:7918 length:465 start_codon:yes stop_codon:yes gene_type:complete